LYNITAS